MAIISGLATMQYYYKTHGEPAWQHGPAAKSPQNGQGLIVIGDYLGLPYLIYWPIRRLDHIARYLLRFSSPMVILAASAH